MLTRLILAGLLINPLAAQASCPSFDKSTATLTISVGPPKADCPIYERADSAAEPNRAPDKTAERPAAEKLRRISDQRYHTDFFAGRQTRYYYGQRRAP